MAHFAEIDNNDVVLRVSVFDDDFTGKKCRELLGGKWIKTSYNNKIKKNFAGIGYTYDKTRKAFIPPKSKNAISLNEKTCQWVVTEEDYPEEK